MASLQTNGTILTDVVCEIVNSNTIFVGCSLWSTAVFYL